MKNLLSFVLEVVLSLVILFSGTVMGDYELQVMFHRFDNPDQRCEECHLSNGSTITAGCCDNLMTGDQCDSRQCDMYFTFCHRLLNTSNSSRECPLDTVVDRKNNSIQNQNGVSFRDAVFGLPNPHTFRGYQWEGTQFYLEIKDRDFMNVDDGPDDLIDTLAVDVDIPVGASIRRTNYTGIFNNTQVELSFRVVCAENYYGPDCTRFCNDSTCPCDPGYTGEFCETNINDCEGVNCSGQGTCVDEIESFSCQCDSGYTGDLCEIDIDYCAGVNCSENGQCVDETESFSCQCDPGYTGDLCETEIDYCAGVNCSGNGQCVNTNNSFSCHCVIGYTGELCGTNIDDCAEVDCGHNAYCIDEVNSYTCKCNDTTYATNTNCKEAAERNNPLVIYTGPIVGGVLGSAVLILILLVVVISLIVRRKRHDSKKTKESSDSKYPTNTQNQESTGGTRFYMKTTQLNTQNSFSEKTKRPAFETKFCNPLFAEDNVDLSGISEPDQDLSSRNSTPIYDDIPDQLSCEMYADVGPVYATLENKNDREKRYGHSNAAFKNGNRNGSLSDSDNTAMSEEHYYQVP